MVSTELPQRPPALAAMVTVPALCTVIMAMPVSGLGWVMSTIELSDALKVTSVGSTLFTTTGTWNVCVPSKAEYMGVNSSLSESLAQAPFPTAPDPPLPLPALPALPPVPGDSPVSVGVLAPQACAQTARTQR